MRLPALLVILIALPLMGAAADPAVRYEISPVFEGEALTAIAVELRVQGDADGETRLRLPDDWGGKPQLWKQIGDIRVDGGMMSADGDAGRLVRHRPGAPLRITYRVTSGYPGDPDASADNPYRPVIRPTWFHLLGNAFIIEPEGHERAPASVRWTGWPTSWTLASDLDHQTQGVRLTMGGVIESVSLGGTQLKVIKRPIAGGTLRVAVQGDWAFDTEVFADHVAQVISAQRNFFGQDQGPYMVGLIPVKSPAGWQSVGGTGRSDAFALFSTSGDVEPVLRSILGHEHVHTWIPARLTRLPEHERADYWFSEGFTDFYAWRSQLRAGVWSLEEFTEAINVGFEEYDTSPARGWTSARYAENFWTDHDAERVPYRRGMLLAFRWDAALLKASGGKANLDRVMLAMADQVKAAGSRDDIPLVRDGLTAAMKRFGVDPTDDIARYVDAGEAFDLPADLFGSCATITAVERPTFERGWNVQKTAEADDHVTGLDPNSPAFKAGLRDGMKIINRDEGKPGDATIQYALRVEDRGAEKVIRFMPVGPGHYRLRHLTLDPTLDAAGRERCRKVMSGET